jgi:O-antigen ligase
MATTLATPATPLSAAFEHKPSSFATRLLLIYVFMLYSRIFETSMMWGVPNLYVMLLLSATALMFVLFKGEFPRTISNPIGILLVLFTGWAAFTLPFSDWRSESLHQLTGVWLKSAACYFIIVGLTKDFDDSRKTFAVFGWAAAVSAVIMAVTNRVIGQRMTSIGSLGNSNEAAFHIIFGLPFLIWLILRVRPILKLPLAAVALLSLALSVKTASRTGLLMAGALTIVALLKVSFANKFKILAVAGVAGLVGLLALDQVALDRYKTMFDDSDSSMTARSARESAESRKYLLKEGIELTLKHPLFGVGMGVFPPAAAELAVSRGDRPLWLVSHNSYVQVSSETGFVGFFLMLGIFGTCFATILKLDRTAKLLGMQEIRNMSLCLLLSFIALTIDYFFDAAAYDLYMPMAAGLCTSLFMTTQPLIAEAQRRAASPEAGRETVPAESSPLVPAGHIPDGTPPVSPSAGRSRNRNPYRLGRRRVLGR